MAKTSSDKKTPHWSKVVTHLLLGCLRCLLPAALITEQQQDPGYVRGKAGTDLQRLCRSSVDPLRGS